MRTARATVTAELRTLRALLEIEAEKPADAPRPTVAGSSARALCLAFTVLYVPDLAATLAFYQTAFNLPARFLHPSGEYAELDTGPVTSAFTQDELSTTALAELPGGYHPNRPDRPPPCLDLAFITDDVRTDTAWDRANEAGARIVSPIIVKPWGQRVGYLRDVNGILLEIGTSPDNHAAPAGQDVAR